MSGGNETKVVFLEMNQVRALRGKLVEEDEKFIKLERKDRTIRIAKSCVIKIEQWRTSASDGD